MAGGGWVKSMQCKSRAYDDVFHSNHSYSCSKTSQGLKDVIDTKTKLKPRKKKPDSKPDPVQSLNTPTRFRESVTVRTTRNPNTEQFFPALTELPSGHPSRNVVEIIFHSSWRPKAFTGRVEMVFKVQNGSRTVTRFEEYRELVKSRVGSSCEPSGEENARCVADGNEMMRFYCLGPTHGGGDSGAWVFPGGKGVAISTFSGSGSAHENAGGGTGRRAMLVSRVIAGRVSKRVGFGFDLSDKRIGFDSVRGDNGELFVLDPCGLLPCFLIIYKL